MDVYYVAIVIVISFTLLALIIGIKSNIFIADESRRYFRLTFLTLIICNFCEMLAIYTLTIKNVELFYFFKSLEFIFTPLAPIFGLKAIKHDVKVSVALHLSIINLILVLLSIYTGWIFTVNINGNYIRGPLYFVHIIIYVINIIHYVQQCYAFCKKYRVNNIAIFIMLVMMLGFAVLLPSALNSKLRLDWTFVSLASILFYIFYNHLIMQTDHLTTLLNRASFDCLISRIKYKSIIIMIDVNDFKKTNDSYGHVYGDECLIKISDSLRKVFYNHGLMSRTGGDEFAVVLSKNIENIDNLIKKFNYEINNIRKTDQNFPSCTIGYAIFNPDIDRFIDILDKADENMYINKRKYHSQN